MDLEDYTQKEMEQAMLQFPLLSRRKCQSLIDLLEDKGFQPLPSEQYNKSERDNLRIFWETSEFTKELFQLAKKFLPSTIQIDESCKTLHKHSLLHGTWKLSHLDSRLRCYRYDKGGHFARHQDYSDHVDPLHHRGLLTILIYLNTVQDGGGTTFYVHDGRRYQPAKTVQPKEGCALVFHQNMTHCGERLNLGHKYCIRTSVLYKRTSPVPELTDDEKEAVQLYKKAQSIPDEIKQIMAITEAQELWKDVEMFVEGH